MLGFRFKEILTGTYARTETPLDNQRLSLVLRAESQSALGALRGSRARLTGQVRADGLVEEAPCAGSLTFSARPPRLSYEIGFTGDDGEPYILSGAKLLALRDLRRRLTELPGTLKNGAGETVARTLTRLDIRADLLDFLVSFRFTRRRRN